ncbi:glycerophosphodiester phosphodiesterase [Metabacillus endolithicus]|uniref:Glycerophosphodiester phosphodiesterase n=1 Tax=Metabacillus endolithicus TaxID=1535204 RepID=A0ABW5BYL0_9BACI|nr:glycerophosphodiester phosphodiesterase [Metabacillus endolithicus]UPG63963.1 glycerophosphodiester phosphodiesterase [Metabacillus endolithicus]
MKIKRFAALIFCITVTVLIVLNFPNLSSKKVKSPPNTNQLIVAHRGASGLAPEHTLASYELGEKVNGTYIEIDLQMTKDGHLVAMHDETVNRTTSGTGFVKDMTLNEIKKLDAGSWFNDMYPQYANEAYKGLEVPTLKEIFQTFGNEANYYIETKSPIVYRNMEEKLLELLDLYQLSSHNEGTKHVIIQSFSSKSLEKIHELNPNIPLVQLLAYKGNATISNKQLATIKKYAIGIGPNFQSIDQAYVEKVRKSGLDIHPYTINDKEEMENALLWGVTGVFTNDPELFQKVLNTFKSSENVGGKY